MLIDKMKRKKKSVGAVFTAIMVISLFAAILPSMSAPQADECTDTSTILEKIQKAIEEKGAKWTAGETSVSGLSIEEKKMLCGAKIGPMPGDAIKISPPEVSMPIGTFDWRNKNGRNWITSVKSQGPCGSCWIFGSTGAFEAQINIDANDPTIDFDSSEQHILSCSGGGDCGGGYPDQALIYIRDSGVPDEACFPYQADDTIPCGNTCPDWQDRACTCEWIGVPEYHTTENYKWILENYGPMVVVLNVSEDLFYYTGGIYAPVWASEEFGQANHCVMLVGYDDTGGYWIIKNSWGPGWGEGGYGGVYYGNLSKYGYAFVVVNTSCQPVEKPDLVITEIWNEGNKIYYTIENKGGAQAGRSYTGLYIDGRYKARDRVSGLAPGDSSTESFRYRYTFTPPSDKIKVCADYRDRIEESDEDNNCKEETWPPIVEKPDLVIEDKWEEGVNGGYIVHYVIHNKGTATAPAGHHTTLIVDGAPIEHKHAPVDLEPCETYTDTFDTVIECTDESDTIKVRADNYYEVDELDEDNNCLENVWLCLRKPDLEIEDKWEEWVNENRYIVTYVIHNSGTATAPGGHSTTLIVDGVPIEHKHVPVDLVPCERYTDTFDTVIECTGESDTIEVCADNYDTIEELDEDNNCLENEWRCEVEEKPDLAIEKIWTKERRGECKVYFVVKNIGTATAPKGHYATLYVVDGEEKEIDHKIVPRALKPGRSYRSSFKTKVACTDTIKVCADDYHAIDELDEENNCLTEVPGWLLHISLTSTPHAFLCFLK